MSFDYTPKTIHDIVFADDDHKDLFMDIINGHHPFPESGKNGILLYGINGTGKSALAKLLPDAIEAMRTGNDAAQRYESIQPGNDGAKLMKSLQSTADCMPFGSSHWYFVLDEVDNLKGPSMASLKSLMNCPLTIFVMTTNHFSDIDAGVRDRCHCIPFNAAPSVKWLPLAKRVLADEGIHTITDNALLPVIDGCNGSARNIVDAMHRVIRNAQKNAVASQTAVPASAV